MSDFLADHVKMIPVTLPPRRNPESICQYCAKPVHYGVTEDGYRGFIHDATNLAACKRTGRPSAFPTNPTDKENDR